MLLNKIPNQNILVIGGAGTIGSNYIKEIIKYSFNPFFQKFAT